jgi:hypothetical protein
MSVNSLLFDHDLGGGGGIPETTLTMALLKENVGLR